MTEPKIETSKVTLSRPTRGYTGARGLSKSGRTHVVGHGAVSFEKDGWGGGSTKDPHGFSLCAGIEPRHRNREFLFRKKSSHLRLLNKSGIDLARTQGRIFPPHDGVLSS